MRNLRSLSHTLLLWCAMLTACDSAARLPVPSRLEHVAGQNQTGVAGRLLAESIAVRVLDETGSPCAGVRVWCVPFESDGMCSPSSALTDAGGLARVSWQLGTTAGRQSLHVSLPDYDVEAVAFNAFAGADSPEDLRVISGDHQQGPVQEPLRDSLVVRAVDIHGNGVGGVEVSWQVDSVFPEDGPRNPDVSGVMVPDVIMTDSLGYAHASWTLHRKASLGLRGIATAFGDTARFTATSVPGPAALVSLEAEDSVIFVPESTSLTLTARDAFENPITGPGFTWTTTTPSIATLSVTGSHTASLVATAQGTSRVIVSVQSNGRADTVNVEVLQVDGTWTIENTGLTAPLFLNDAGEVAGLKAGHVVLWRDGNIVADYGSAAPGRTFTVVAINNRGTIAAWESNGDSWLFGPGVSQTRIAGARVTDINDSGTVVGYFSGNRTRGFVWQGGSFTYLDPVNGSGTGSSTPISINNQDQVVVKTLVVTQLAMQLWEKGEYTTIPAPDATSCQTWTAGEINDAGQVLVNCWRSAPGFATWVAWTAFRWTRSSTVSLHPISVATTLTDDGRSAGWGARKYLAGTELVTYYTTYLGSSPLVNGVQGTVKLNRHGWVLLHVMGRARLLVP